MKIIERMYHRIVYHEMYGVGFFDSDFVIGGLKFRGPFQSELARIMKTEVQRFIENGLIDARFHSWEEFRNKPYSRFVWRG